MLNNNINSYVDSFIKNAQENGLTINRVAVGENGYMIVATGKNGSVCSVPENAKSGLVYEMANNTLKNYAKSQNVSKDVVKETSNNRFLK